MIMGRPLIKLLRLQINFAADRIERDELYIPMEPTVKSNAIHFTTGIEEPEATKESLRRVKDILRAKYSPVSVKQILEASPHLTRAQKDSLEPILNKHASLFDGGHHRFFSYWLLIFEKVCKEVDKATNQVKGADKANLRQIQELINWIKLRL